LAPFGFKVFVNRILIEAGRRLPPTFNYVRDAASFAANPFFRSEFDKGRVVGDNNIRKS
jgi:hypothetical protein